jgi:hypothetical protein
MQATASRRCGLRAGDDAGRHGTQQLRARGNTALPQAAANVDQRFHHNGSDYVKKRYIFGALALFATAYFVRLSLKLRQEYLRYNHILSMSDEGNVMEETPELLLQVVKQQAQTIKELKNFARSAPKDVARYLKIEAM